MRRAVVDLGADLQREVVQPVAGAVLGLPDGAGVSSGLPDADVRQVLAGTVAPASPDAVVRSRSGRPCVCQVGRRLDVVCPVPLGQDLLPDRALHGVTDVPVVVLAGDIPDVSRPCRDLLVPAGVDRDVLQDIPPQDDDGGRELRILEPSCEDHALPLGYGEHRPDPACERADAPLRQRPPVKDILYAVLDGLDPGGVQDNVPGQPLHGLHRVRRSLRGAPAHEHVPVPRRHGERERIPLVV